MTKRDIIDYCQTKENVTYAESSDGVTLFFVNGTEFAKLDEAGSERRVLLECDRVNGYLFRSSYPQFVAKRGRSGYELRLDEDTPGLALLQMLDHAYDRAAKTRRG